MIACALYNIRHSAIKIDKKLLTKIADYTDIELSVRNVVIILKNLSHQATRGYKVEKRT